MARTVTGVWAARRNAEFYAQPGYAEQSHIVAGFEDDDRNHLMPACNQRNTWPHGMILLPESVRPSVEVPPVARCQRPGCRSRWPDDYRPHRRTDPEMQEAGPEGPASDRSGDRI